MTKVSVIMPVYDCEDYLKDSVESILNQTLSDLELICVDDGSTDNSLNILKEYEKEDSRIIVFGLDHAGGGNARNFALNHVSGEYLYFMDADDVLDLNAFEDFYPISKSKNLDFLIFKAKKHDVKTGKYFETDYYNMKNLSNFVKDKVFKFDDIGNLIFGINVTPWCKFYNTQFILNTGAKFRENSKFHDNKFFWEILFQAEKIFFLDKFYYTQNIHSDSLIESCGKSHMDAIPVSNDTINIFIKHNQFDKFKANLFNSKVYHTIRRYDEIQDVFKELYFTELKKDFKLLKCSDFRNNLYSHNKFLFDCVLIAKNYDDFNHLKEFCEVFTNNHLSLGEKIEKYKEWYDCLDDDYKQLFFDNPKSMNIYNYLVSVIIPTYNSESFIKNTFDSLLRQTIGFEKLEVIFVDDASCDNTPQIIDELSLKYENVVSFHLDKNSGAGGKPRDVGMDYATADYLMFLDSDDLFFEDACEFLHDEITTENIDVVSGAITKDGENVSPGLWENTLTSPEDNFHIRQNKVRKLVTDDFTLKINSIDDCESVIANYGFSSKIYKKSFLLKNNIYFPYSTVAEDSVFLLNVLLNAHGIKFINKIVYYYIQRTEDGNASINFTITKESMINRLNSYFKMFSISMEKNKSQIFKKYLLFDKLNYFINAHVLKCNLSVNDLLDVLVHATPLFRLYVNYNPNLNIGTATLFKYIANKDYENALKEIYGHDTKNQKDIKVAVNSDKFSKDSFIPEVNMFVLSKESWAEQMESEKPDLFLFKSQDGDEEILNYCNGHNIQAVQWDGDSGNLNDILDSIKFKYIPDLNHLVLIYRLDDLKSLNDITNHFYSIKYPFKHLKMITTEENLFLNNTILESDLANIDFGDNYYYCFADLDFKFNENAFNKDYKKFTDSNTFMRDMKQHELLFKENVLLKEINETKINILDMDASLDLLLDNRKSISRIGDGEVKIILGRNPGFQKFDQKLSDRLREILYNNDQDFCYIGVPNELNGFNNRIPATKEYWINYLYSYRKKWLDLLNLEKIYLNANITRPYLRFLDKSKCESYFESFKKLWHNKNVILCEGEFSRVGVNNDLLSNCKSIKRVLCPHKDAFSKYDEIFNRLKRYGKDNLFLIALGPTATVLSYDLAEEGYYALDIGHLDIEYEWFLRKATKKIAIENKWINEVPENTITETFYDEDYFNQIDCIIK